MTRPVTGRVTPEQRRSPGAPAALTIDGDLPFDGPRAPGAARIAVDLLGGDHAPAVVVGGALRACQADPTLQLLLAGPPDVAGEILAALAPADRLRVRWTAHRDATSITTAVRAVVDGHADAVVSAGPTGATVTAAALGLGRQPDLRQPDLRQPDLRQPDLRQPDLRHAEQRQGEVRRAGKRRSGARRRPALIAVLPTATGRVLLLDVGASTDPDASTLAAHALLGAAYAITVHGIDRPRIGLLSIGTEDGKGDRVRRAAAPLFADLRLPAGAHYVGLVEGHEAVLGGHADVVVTDGFTGNVLLKGIEAAYSLMAGPARSDAPARSDLPDRAAALLGVAGTVVVCHGAATGDDLASGIALAARLHRIGAVAALTALISGAPPPRGHPAPDPTPCPASDCSTSDHEVTP